MLFFVNSRYTNYFCIYIWIYIKIVKTKRNLYLVLRFFLFNYTVNDWLFQSQASYTLPGIEVKVWQQIEY